MALVMYRSSSCVMHLHPTAENLPSLASSLSPRNSSHYSLHSHYRMRGESRKNKSAYLCCTALVRVSLSTLISEKFARRAGDSDRPNGSIKGHCEWRIFTTPGTTRTGTGLFGLRLLPIRLAPERRCSPVESKLRPKFLRREKIGKGEAEERCKQSDTPVPC